MTDGHVHGTPPAAPDAPAAVPSWKLLATLGFAGCLAGGLIVVSYQATLPKIEAHRGAMVASAVSEVLKAPARWDTLYLVGGALTKAAPTGTDSKKIERLFLGFDESGALLGAAVTAGEPAFADVISVIFGIDPTTGTLLGMKVLGHKETPGLGDKIEQPKFLEEFAGAQTPLKGVKAKGTDPSEVQTITGATISSRAVIRIINNATARWQPLLQAYLKGGSR